METILDLKVVIDPDWVGSVSPYRVIQNGVTYRPMTMAEVESQMAYATQAARRQAALYASRNKR